MPKRKDSVVEFNEEETARRRDEALRNALTRPYQAKKKIKPLSKKKRAKSTSKSSTESSSR